MLLAVVLDISFGRIAPYCVQKCSADIRQSCQWFPSRAFPALLVKGCRTALILESRKLSPQFSYCFVFSFQTGVVYLPPKSPVQDCTTSQTQTKTPSLCHMLRQLLFYGTLLHLDKSVEVKPPFIKKALLRTLAHLFLPTLLIFAGLCWLTPELKHRNSNSFKANTAIYIPSHILHTAL